MSEPEIKYLGEVQRLALKPGDRIVLNVDRELTHEQSERLRSLVAERIKGHDVIVLTKGIKIGVLEAA